MRNNLTDLSTKLETAFDFAQSQVKQLIEERPDFFPIYTESGLWVHEGESWTNWCEGFPGGMMWIFHKRTGDDWWRQQAERYSLLIEERKTDHNVHDLGFLFWSTWKRWYDLYDEERPRCDSNGDCNFPAKAAIIICPLEPGDEAIQVNKCDKHGREFLHEFIDMGFEHMT